MGYILTLNGKIISTANDEKKIRTDKQKTIDGYCNLGNSGDIDLRIFKELL